MRGTSASIELLSELGIAILLFLVGIKLDLKLTRSLGPVSVMTGLGQVAFTAIFGYLIGLGLGFGHVESLYVAVALTFSSTIIIVKLLSDKREIDSLHGQIALGFLIVQDLVVVIAMIVLSTFGMQSAGDEGDGRTLWTAAGSAALMLVVVLLFVRFAADRLTRMLATSPELLVLFAIALAAAFAAIGDAMGLGKEVGGLVAGIALASTPYRETISARLAPLRDFLLLFFFIALGASLELPNLSENLGAAFVLSLFVLIGNPIIVMAIMGAMGYRKRTGFLAGLTVAQISEFSLVFIAMGVSLGHVGADALGLVTLVGLITIAASTYMITWSHHLFAWCEPLLSVFERRDPFREANQAPSRDADAPDLVIFGLGRFGTAIGIRLAQRGIRVLGIDFNPEAIQRWQTLGLTARHGDATDPEFVAELPLRGAKWLVSTVPITPINLSMEDSRQTLVQTARSAGFAGRVAVASHHAADTSLMGDAGVDLVLEPFQDAADRAVDLLCGAAAMARTDFPALPTEGPPGT
jgi:Kef-type K+ transport system membrane component KefB